MTFNASAPVVFPEGAMQMDHGSPLDARLGFIRALLGDQRIEAGQSHLTRLPEQTDPRVQTLQAAFTAWRKNLNWLQRLGLKSPSQFEVPLNP